MAEKTRIIYSKLSSSREETGSPLWHEERTQKSHLPCLVGPPLPSSDAAVAEISRIPRLVLPAVPPLQTHGEVFHVLGNHHW